MTKSELKRAILGQLSSKLDARCVLDGTPSDDQLRLAMAAQKELAAEFRRRSRGQPLSTEWTDRAG